eukprot:g6434.t1
MAGRVKGCFLCSDDRRRPGIFLYLGIDSGRKMGCVSSKCLPCSSKCLPCSSKCLPCSSGPSKKEEDAVPKQVGEASTQEADDAIPELSKDEPLDASMTSRTKSEMQPKRTETPKKPENFFIASGASILEDSAAAIKEAYAGLVEDFEKRCKASMPLRLLICFASPSYDHEVLAKTLIEVAGGVKFVITTSADGAISDKMLAMSPTNYGLSLQGFKCDEPDAFFGVGHAKIEDSNGDHVACAAKAASDALMQMQIQGSSRWDDKAHGHKSTHKIKGDYVVFFSSAEYPDFTRSEHLFFTGVRSVFGSDTLMCGGTACCNSDFSGKPFVTAGADGKFAISMTAVTLAVIVVPASVSVKSTSKGFFDPTPLSSAKVTSHGSKPGFPSERIVGTLDNKPAAEVLDEWWSGRLKPFWETAKEKKEPVSILLAFAMNPCGRLFKSSKGAAFGLCSVLEVLPDGAVSFIAPMPIGVDMMAFEGSQGSQDRILEKMSYIGSFPSHEVLGGFASICCLATWPNRARVEEYRERYYQPAKMAADQSFAIMCAYGEVGCADGSKKVGHYNCSFCETLFVSKENKTYYPDSESSVSSSATPSQSDRTIALKQTRLRKILDGDDANTFLDSAKACFSLEMVNFWQAVEEFSSMRADVESKGMELSQVLKFKSQYDDVYKTYIREGATKEVNIPSELRRALLKVYRKEVLGVKEVDIVFRAQDEVEQLIELNITPKFFKSHPGMEGRYTAT